MNPTEYKDIINRLSSLESNYSELKQRYSGLAIDQQYFLRANSDIKANTATRVTFDHHGLVLRGDSLREVDIPTLSIEHISNLQESLDSKASKKSLDRLKRDITTLIPSKGVATKSGIKVNYDDNGLVVSTSELLASDIPLLPMEKIEGLDDLVKALKDEPTTLYVNYFNHSKVTAGTYSKVTVDEYGHVVKGEHLSESDIPQSFMNKLNYIESRLPTLANQSSVDGINDQLSKKLDANIRKITSGTYTKYTVDENGLITGTDSLSINDIPNLPITKVTNLSTELNNKALRSEFISLSETVNSLSSIVTRLSSPNIDIERLATKESVSDVAQQVNQVDSKISQILDNVPVDMIKELLDSLILKISNVEGRLSALEKYLNIPDNV